MNLLPYDKFCIVTSLKPAEVEAQLESETSPDPGWGLKRIFADEIDTWFVGTIENGSFKLTRIKQEQYNHAPFLSVIEGHTEGWLNGSRIYVQIRLRILVALFIGAWICVAAVTGFWNLITSLISNQFSPIMLVPFGMVIFGYLMILGFYSYERSKIKAILLGLLSGQIDETAVFSKKIFR